jgi:hypothetical protein
MNDQFIRRASLVLTEGDKGLDLSNFRIRFNIENADIQSPGSMACRVYNLSKETISQVQKEFSKVTLNAGYQEGNYGIVFSGTIKQFRVGRENNKDTYLDILAADGDYGFNYGVVNFTLAAGANSEKQIKEIVKNMPGIEIDENYEYVFARNKNFTNIRGKTFIGMAKSKLRNLASSLDFSWSIENGKVVIIPTTGYRPGEAVVINVATGLIGTPEQTDSGIALTCLLNSKLRIGGLVRLNNDEINQLIFQKDASQVNYKSYTEIEAISPLSTDGMYRVYSVEHEGDTSGQAWYSHLNLLAVDISANKDESVSP